MKKILEVISVNISKKKGTCKKPVKEIFLDDTGLVGDAHSGSWNRQVSLLGIESIKKFTQKTGKTITNGEFAENITTQGMSLTDTKPLDRFISGDSMLEVTQIGKKCHGNSCTIFNETGNCIMPKEGIFCRVLQPGIIKPGDKFEYIPYVFKILVLTISDRAKSGIYKDVGGPTATNLVSDFFDKEKYKSSCKNDMVADDPNQIEREIIKASKQNTDLIITTGGTGIGPKDYTPDVVKKIIDKEIPGIMEYIRLTYGTKNPNALLSRSIAGVKDNTLIYALPGNPNAVKEYLSEITSTLLHSIYMLHRLDLH